MSEQGIYGIDLGTTYSVVAYIDETGRAAVVRNTDGDDTTPSVVYFETADNFVVGKTAKEAASFRPDDVVSLIKREMGNQDYTRTFYGQELSPSGISALILAALAKSAEEETHRPVKQVVITVPAYFGLLEKDATKKAGEIAGLDVIGIVPEPVAAALAYGVTGSADGTTFLVYDLGGGTFDITLIKMTDTSVEVLAVDGDHKLGGADWDARLFEYLKDQNDRAKRRRLNRRRRGEPVGAAPPGGGDQEGTDQGRVQEGQPPARRRHGDLHHGDPPAVRGADLGPARGDRSRSPTGCWRTPSPGSPAFAARSTISCWSAGPAGCPWCRNGSARSTRGSRR